MRIARIQTTHVYIPYRSPVGPYRSRRSVTEGAASTIVRIETEEGLVGWGEGGGRMPADPNSVLAGLHPGDLETALARMTAAGFSTEAASGIEMALWDLIGKAASLPLCRLLGGLCREEVELCACQGIREPAAAAEAALESAERWGFRTLKTKAGLDVEEDLRIARAIRAAVGERAVLRPDANQGYSPEDAERVLRGMREIGGIHYFEDPCEERHLDALARFRREIGLPIAVNMGVSTPASVLEIVRAGAADVVMPDTTSSGGIWQVKQVAAVAGAAGVPCVMHCSHDLGLKTAAVAHIMASTPAFTLAADTTYHGLTGDILAEPFRIQGGSIRVPLAPGLGVTVDEEMLRKYRVGC